MRRLHCHRRRQHETSHARRERQQRRKRRRRHVDMSLKCRRKVAVRSFARVKVSRICPPRAQPLQTPPSVRLKVRLRSAGPLASVNTSTEYSLLRDTLLIIMLVRSLSTPAAKQRALTTRGRSQTEGGPGSGGEPRFRDYEAPAHIRSGLDRVFESSRDALLRGSSLYYVKSPLLRARGSTKYYAHTSATCSHYSTHRRMDRTQEGPGRPCTEDAQRSHGIMAW